MESCGVSHIPLTVQRSLLGAERHVTIWNVESRTMIGQPFIGHTNWVRCVAFSSSREYLASGSNDKIVRIWELKRNVLLGKPRRGHNSSIRGVAFSSHGKEIVTISDDKTVRVWDVRMNAYSTIHRTIQCCIVNFNTLPIYSPMADLKSQMTGGLSTNIESSFCGSLISTVQDSDILNFGFSTINPLPNSTLNTSSAARSGFSVTLELEQS